MEIDGKTVRRSADKANGKSPIHIVGAWATASGAALRRLALKGEKSLKIGVSDEEEESGLGFGILANDTPIRSI